MGLVDYAIRNQEDLSAIYVLFEFLRRFEAAILTRGQVTETRRGGVIINLCPGAETMADGLLPPGVTPGVWPAL